MKPVILIIDDNQEIMDFIYNDLCEEYGVLKAFDGAEALALMEETSVQLIISDIMMPGMDGFEFCRIVKSRVDLCHIPVILLTARNTLQSKIEGLELGADAYIEKPFSPRHLRAQVSSLLANRTKIREYFSSSPLAHLMSIAHTRAEEEFLGQLNHEIIQRIADPGLDVDELSRALNMSRSTLYRKIKDMSDMAPAELINLSRLKKAAELLLDGRYSIGAIAEKVGFSNQTIFGRQFLRQFGMTPSAYIESKKTGHE